MSLTDKSTEDSGPRLERINLNESPAGDLAMEEALKNFKMSVHAWSDAVYNRPRLAAQARAEVVRQLAVGLRMGLGGFASGRGRFR